MGGAALGFEGIANLTTPEEDRRLADAAAASQGARARYGDATLSAARGMYQPWWKRRALGSEDADDPRYVDQYLNEMNIRRRGGRSQPSAPYIDPAVLGPAAAAADEAKSSISELDGMTASPKIDTGSIDDATAKAQRLKSLLQELSTLSRSIRSPSIRQQVHGLYSDTGLGVE
jgi:hypothetical protein